MVIQRIQSVYLLIAVILMAIFAFFPALSFQLGDRTFVYGALEAGKVGVTHIDPLMLMLVVLISLLAFIDIFLFKNGHRWRRLSERSPSVCQRIRLPHRWRARYH